MAAKCVRKKCHWPIMKMKCDSILHACSERLSTIGTHEEIINPI